MTVASAASGTPESRVWRSRDRRSSRKMSRLTISSATDPNRSVSAAVRFPATVPVPAASPKAADWRPSRLMRSSTSAARKASKSAKCRCRTPLATLASVVTARLVRAFGPARSRTRSAASNSWARASRMATPVGTVHLSFAASLIRCARSRLLSGRVPT